MKRWMAQLAVIGLMGCHAAPQPRMVQFDEAEYTRYGSDGTGAITGQAFLKTRAGDVKYGAGCTVILNPVTSYSTEWYTRWVVGGVALEPGDQRASKYTRQVIADGEGRFAFQGLPEGEYYVASQIIWEYPTRYGLSTTGGNVYAQVSVTEGETETIVLTR